MSQSQKAMNITGMSSILGGFFSDSNDDSNPAPISVDRTSICEIPLKEIYQPPQPRKFFNTEEIEKLQDAIKNNGFQGTVLVTLLADDHPERNNGFKYELVYGASRSRAMAALGKETIPAEVRADLNEQQIRRIRLNENLIRANLNPLEEAEGLIEIMADEAGVTVVEVERDLNTFSNAKKRQTEMTCDVSRHLECYQAVLDYYKKGTLSSFRTQLIKFRSLPDDVAQAVERGEIDASKALEIGAVKDRTLREQLLNWVAQDNPSVKRIREEKRTLLEKQNETGKKTVKKNSLRSHVQKSWERLSNSVVLDSPSPEAKQKIEQIQKLIDELLRGE